MLQPSDAPKGLNLAIIGLGSNMLRDREGPVQILQSALTQLMVESVVLKATSQFYATPCFPAGAGPDYVNAAALLETSLTPADLLEHLHRIEALMGREREARWGQRTLDLDLLAYGDAIAPDLAGYLQWRDLPLAAQATDAPSHLILPHPRLQDRAFVLVPMNDIAPDWRHPVTQRSTRQMLADLAAAEIAQIVPL